MDLIKDNQIKDNQIEKVKLYVGELEREVDRFRDTYENKIFYERGLQTDPVEFVSADIRIRLGNLEMENSRLR